MQDKMSLLCTFSGSNNSFLHFNHSGLNGKLSILKRLQVSSCPNESWILELKVVFTCSNLKLDTWILSVCVCVWVCRGGSTEFVGVPDMSALHAHSAPGEGAGTGQTVCWDPPLHSALWWAEGLLWTMSRNTHTPTHTVWVTPPSLLHLVPYTCMKCVVYSEAVAECVFMLFFFRWEFLPSRTTSATTEEPSVETG